MCGLRLPKKNRRSSKYNSASFCEGTITTTGVLCSIYTLDTRYAFSDPASPVQSTQKSLSGIESIKDLIDVFA
jgi:hypothetical protein